jgi:hypothetical protein
LGEISMDISIGSLVAELFEKAKRGITKKIINNFFRYFSFDFMINFLF